MIFFFFIYKSLHLFVFVIHLLTKRRRVFSKNRKNYFDEIMVRENIFIFLFYDFKRTQIRPVLKMSKFSNKIGEFE